jgi:hypothetical protein
MYFSTNTANWYVMEQDFMTLKLEGGIALILGLNYLENGVHILTVTMIRYTLLTQMECYQVQTLTVQK